MSVPTWVQDAIFYQIFPDRFANGDSGIDPANIQPWGAPPNRWDYQGGDLSGIIQHMDYLLDLGINALYLNPIFHASANHRYHTIDYYKIDPFLGTLGDFKELLEIAHRNDIRVILDGVLNHCGRGFFAFNNILENWEHSPYLDWFHVKKFPLDAYGKGKAKNYEAWWSIKELPKFNTDNAEVRDYLFGMTRYWTELGIDGWRLDVPNEIDNDGFWAEYRRLVKSINPDAYLVGEIWNLDPCWVDENHFDAVMNYPLRDAIIDPLNGIKAPFSLLPETLEALQETYTLEQFLTAFNTLGSHDTKRLMTKVREPQLAKLAFANVFAQPGAPAIYYGDEIGLKGGLDPECRAAFPWDEKDWNSELRAWVQMLITIRKVSTALRHGSLRQLFRDDDHHVLAFERAHEEEKILVALNYSAERRTWVANLPQLDVPVATYKDLLSDTTLTLQGDNLAVDLPPFTARWLVSA